MPSRATLDGTVSLHLPPPGGNSREGTTGQAAACRAVSVVMCPTEDHYLQEPRPDNNRQQGRRQEPRKIQLVQVQAQVDPRTANIQQGRKGRRKAACLQLDI